MAFIGTGATPVDPEPSELLRYLPTYRVVVCATCRYAVQPHAIPRHLKDIHHIHRSRRRQFMQYVLKLRLDEPGNVIERKINEFPVPLLPVLDGLKCKSRDCLHLCVSEKRMKSHWLSVHGRPGQEILDWQPALLQTFFRGNLLRYFTKCAGLSNEVQHSSTMTFHGVLKSTNELQGQNFLDDDDTALLHHYISSTSITIAHDERSEALWQEIVPQLARQHPFLMHGLLACSALHLAYKIPHVRDSILSRQAVIKILQHLNFARQLPM